MQSARITQPDVPWDTLLKQVDDAIEDMFIKFESAFAEAQDVKYKTIGPREEIKRGMFRKVWGELEKQRNFRNLAELDAYYQNVRHNLTKYRNDFIVLDYVRGLCEAHNIMPGEGEECVISTRKMQMLKKIVNLYHALIRNRFVIANLQSSLSVNMDKLHEHVERDVIRLQKQLARDKAKLQKAAYVAKTLANADIAKIDADLNEATAKLDHQFENNRFHLGKRLERSQYLLTPDRLEDIVTELTMTTSINVELMKRMTMTSYLTQIEALKSFNYKLIEVLKSKGYGDASVEFMQPEDKKIPAVFFEVNGKLVDLPVIDELVKIINGEMYDSNNMRAYKLKEYVDKIRVFRYVLKQIRDDVVGASKKNLDIVNYDYDGLRQVHKVDQAEILNNYFLNMDMLLRINDSSSQSDNPALKDAVSDVIAQCGQQSQAEQILPLVNNGWKIASDSVKENITKLLILIRDNPQIYLQQKAVYKQKAKGNVDAIIQKFQGVQKVLIEWGVVNEQTLCVLNECDKLLAIVEATVAAAMQSNKEYITGFLKRNWPSMAIVAGVCLAPAIAVPLAVASTATLAVTVPAAVVGGNALGAGVGMIKDKVKMQNKEDLPPVVPSANGVKTKLIIDNLFKEPETILGREVILEEDDDVALSADDLKEIDVNIPYEPGIMQKYMPGMSTLVSIPSQLTEAVTAVPSMVASTIPDAVTDAVIYIPSKLINLPGQLTTIPSLFSRQPVKPDKEPVIDNPGELTSRYRPQPPK
jgi:hypothetical protein